MTIASPPAGQLGMATPFGELLGASSAELEAEMADYASMGVDWVRIDFWWRDIQWTAADGPYNWGNHDKVVAAANKYGIKVIAELQGVPSWAKASGGMASDANIKAYVDFAKAAVEHFKGKVQHWEIWNEPNLTMYWGAYPNPADYTKALKAAYTAIKAVDPNSFVISGGLSPSPESGSGWYGAVEFVKQMYANGAKGNFDALGFHPYSWPLMPDDPAAWNGWEIMETGIRGQMVANGDGAKQVWMTEMGAPTSGPNAVSHAKQAEMIKQAVELAKGYDWAGPLMWYSYQDRGGSTDNTENYFGLKNPDGSRKAAYDTFKTLALADGTGGDPTPIPTPSPTDPAPFTGTVSPDGETGTVMGSGDVADDPAIWVNPADATKSLIIGTSKATNGGLVVWDLTGREVSRFVANDPYNNVDVSGNLVGVSNRDTKAMDFFRIDGSGKLTKIGSVASGLSDVYGFALAQVNGKTYAAISTKSGLVRQFEITEGTSVSGKAVRDMQVTGQVEGIEFDPANGNLYIASETTGLYKFKIDPAAGNQKTQIAAIGQHGLAPDAEGVAIYDLGGGKGYVLLSSQGNSSVKVFDRQTDKFLGTFNVSGVQNTDGLDVSSANLGSGFGKGMLVVHDEFNTGQATSNFKIVAWEGIQKLIGSVSPLPTPAPIPSNPTTSPTFSGASYTGSDLAQTIVGNSLDNVIYGRGGNDTIYGGAGNDTVEGNMGNDVLHGGAGNDTFIIGSSEAMAEVILDFTKGQDRIDLGERDANLTASGTQDFSFIGAAAFSRAGQLRAYQDLIKGITIIEGNIDADTAAEMRIECKGIVTFAQTDFLL